MLYIILTMASPFLIWAWWGVAFTITDFVLHCAGDNMETIMLHLVNEANASPRVPDRIIRYTDLSTPFMLSRFDPVKNILSIDKELAEILPVMIRNRLECTELPATRIIDDGKGLRFGAFDVTL